MKNRAFHEGIKQTPYEALFGTRMKLGLKTSNLPTESVEQLETEEELEQLLEGIHTANSPHSKVAENYEFSIETLDIILDAGLLCNQTEDKDGSFELNSVLNEKKILIDNARKKARENLENQNV